MKFAATLLFSILIAFQCTAAGAPPENLKEAADSADGVIVGLHSTFGTGGQPYVDFYILDVLKGPNLGEVISVSIPPEAISGIDIQKIFKTHGNKYIVAYKKPRNEKGQYIYNGPRFDSKEIIPTPNNINTVKPGALAFKLPSFEQAVKEADVVAVATYVKYKPDWALNKFLFTVKEVFKGNLRETSITYTLDGRYLYWFTNGGVPAMQEKLNPLIENKTVVLILKKAGEKLYYAGPGFTSSYLPATAENIAKARQLADAYPSNSARNETQPPIASFRATTACGIRPFTVQFFEACGGPLESWQWDFNGDGAVDSILENPSCIYKEPGIYTVTLTVTGPGGSAREVRTNYIVVLEPLSADFRAEPVSGVAPLLVQFHDGSTGSVTARKWDLDGDGKIDSTQENPVHTYKTAGTYTVSFTVFGAAGKDTKKKENLIVVSLDIPVNKFDWTWWIVGAAAAVVAFIAALVMSKIDYKYDRRRERLEKLRNRGDSDTDADKPGG